MKEKYENGELKAESFGSEEENDSVSDGEKDANGEVTVAENTETDSEAVGAEPFEGSEINGNAETVGAEETNDENAESADFSESERSEKAAESTDKAEGGDGTESTENGESTEKKKRTRRRAASEDEQSDGTESAIAPEKMPRSQAMRVLEAIMFANGDEVYYDQFAKIIGYTTKEAKKIVDAYAKMYDSGSMPRGIRLVKYDKCCQLTTDPDLGEYVTQMIGIRGEPQLSAAAMETLAIVAYNQPVTRAYIEQVRRVDSTRPITVLLDRELIEEKGRLEVIGRPRLFGTTQNFLKTFGITSLDALPSLDLFAVDG